MNSLQVKYFLTLCKERSFSRAAEKLYVTQPSFSQFIKKIETELSAELVDRSCTPIKLTGAGEAYYNACVQFAAVEEDMLSTISNLSELKSGSLAIGTTSFRAATMLSKSIAAFKKEYSGIDITITEGSVTYLENAVSSGEIDLAICSCEPDNSIFRYEALADEQLYMAVPKDNPVNEVLSDRRLEFSDITGNSLKLLKTAPCDISIFASMPYISLEHGGEVNYRAERIFSEAGISPDAIINAQSINTAFSLVLEGMGITAVPDTMIKYGNLSRHPYYYAINSKEAINRIYLVTRKNRYLSRAAEEYSRILKQLIASGTWRI